MELESAVDDAFRHVLTCGEWEVQQRGFGSYSCIKKGRRIVISLSYLKNHFAGLSFEDQLHLQCEALRLYLADCKEKKVTTKKLLLK